MQNMNEQNKHARGSYLSVEELHEGQGNMKREFRSLKEIPVEPQQEHATINFTVQDTLPKLKPEREIQWHDDGGEG